MSVKKFPLGTFLSVVLLSSCAHMGGMVDTSNDEQLLQRAVANVIQDNQEAARRLDILEKRTKRVEASIGSGRETIMHLVTKGRSNIRRKPSLRAEKRIVEPYTHLKAIAKKGQWYRLISGEYIHQITVERLR